LSASSAGASAAALSGGGEAGAGHALTQAAFFQKIPLQPAELLVEQVARHLDQTHNDVGADRGVGVLNAFLEGLVIRAGCTVEPAEAEGITVVGRPFLDTAGTHEIAVVFDQLFLAGTGHVGKLDFGFLGCTAELAAFEDVLLAGAGGLHHLVVRAGFFVYETVAEMERGLKNHEGFVVGEQLLVASVRWDESVSIARRKGRKGL
jgi:hypothetical protein